jgi:single-stranded DNA-binding protein
MFSVAITGYVTGNVEVENNDYGKRATLSLRVKSGKQTHYFNCYFYGKKIELAEKYMHDGRQVSLTGSVRAVSGKKRKDDTDYCAFYVDVSDFSFPERLDGEERYSQAPKSQARSQQNDPEEDEVPF